MLQIALIRINAGDIENALGVGRLIKEPVRKGRLLMEIAIVQEKRGDQATAKTTFQNALQLLDGIPMADDVASVLASGRARMGDMAGALLASKAILDVSSRDGSLAEIAKVQTERGNTVAAMESLELMQGEYEKAIALKDIVIIQANAGDIECAIRSAGAIQDHYMRATALQRIAKAQYKMGDRDPAKRTFLQAIQAAKLVEIGGGTNVIVLSDIALTQAEVGDQDASRITFQQAREKVQMYPDESYRAILLQGVAEAQAKGGQEKEAYAWAVRSSSCVVRAYALLGIAKGILARPK